MRAITSLSRLFFNGFVIPFFLVWINSLLRHATFTQKKAQVNHVSMEGMKNKVQGEKIKNFHNDEKRIIFFLQIM